MRGLALCAVVAAIGLGGSATPSYGPAPAKPVVQAAPRFSIHCGSPRDASEASVCAEARSADAAKDQAAAAWKQVDLSRWQVWGLVASVLLSGLATVFAALAARAASKSASAIPVLERAYVYPLIHGEHVSGAITLAKNIRDHGHAHLAGNATPSVWVKFKNFGKTPATLVYGEVVLSFVPSSKDVREIQDLPIRYNYVLGEGEETEFFEQSLGRDLTYEEAIAVEKGEIGILLWGWMTYRDIWGETQECGVSFNYNPKLQRMDYNDIKSPKKKRRWFVRTVKTRG